MLQATAPTSTSSADPDALAFLARSLWEFGHATQQQTNRLSANRHSADHGSAMSKLAARLSQSGQATESVSRDYAHADHRGVLGLLGIHQTVRPRRAVNHTNIPAPRGRKRVVVARKLGAAVVSRKKVVPRAANVKRQPMTKPAPKPKSKTGPKPLRKPLLNAASRLALKAGSRSVSKAVRKSALKPVKRQVQRSAPKTMNGVVLAIARSKPFVNESRIVSAREVRKILRMAASQIGVKEKRTNRTKYGRWYGMNGQAWCAMFVSWVAARAGVPLPRINSNRGFAAVVSGRNFARKNNLLTTKPRVGSVFLIIGRNGKGHTGFVESVNWARRTITTIEGNTNAGGSRNGDGVYRRTRKISAINGGFMLIPTKLPSPKKRPR